MEWTHIEREWVSEQFQVSNCHREHEGVKKQQLHARTKLCNNTSPRQEIA